ncbi:MAG: hypothetical protein JWM20_699 [Patescibacteria group bacterium]|nr:hypothetical protein [Patescibacteria group bacterium]
MNKLSDFLKSIFILPIRAYQAVLRPLFPSACVFHAHGMPGCSDYTIMAIKKYGPLKGIIVGTGRILRCHPWQKNFYDPMP